jgi:hypothetical protein
VIRSVEVQLLDHDPVVIDYRTFFSYLDWSLVDRWQAERVLSELRSQKSVLDAWDAHLSLMDLGGCLYHCL